MRLYFFILVSVFSAAANANKNKIDFCSAAQNKSYFQDRLLNEENLIAFKNDGKYSALNLIGINQVEIGICWWHSRLQRSLNYLALARPLSLNEKPMTKNEIGEALLNLINEREVVELRGYESIHQFTAINQKVILEFLKYWQLSELKHAVRGLQGHYQVAPKELLQLMNQLYARVTVNQSVAYQMQQMPGLNAHSWLVTHMKKRINNNKLIGYDIIAIDSQLPTIPITYSYTIGDTQVKSDLFNGAFVPYTQRTGSERRYLKALAVYCRPQKTKAIFKKKFGYTPQSENLINDFLMSNLFSNSDVIPKRWNEILK